MEPEKLVQEYIQLLRDGRASLPSEAAAQVGSKYGLQAHEVLVMVARSRGGPR